MQSKRGFLDGPYKIFYLKDQGDKVYDAHYHDFHKCVIVLSGTLTYFIEGVRYGIRSGDVIFVNQYEVHKLEVSGNESYERLVIYLSPHYLYTMSTEITDLKVIFNRENIKVLSYTKDFTGHLEASICRLKEVVTNLDYGQDLLIASRLMEVIVLLNGQIAKLETIVAGETITYDERILKALAYINKNISIQMSIDELSALTYMSKYHLMRIFKEQTGYSIHQYIMGKRLNYVIELVRDGHNYSEAALKAGFGDYSVFLRAFKKRYQVNPKTYFENGKGSLHWKN